jgi:hypothetical protein
MKFHKKLVRVTLVHLPVCLAVFYALNEYQRREEEIALNTSLGGIFWIGMFAIAAPAFLKDETRAQLFMREYFWGTFILSIVNMLIGPVCAVLTAGQVSA